MKQNLFTPTMNLTCDLHRTL